MAITVADNSKSGFYNSVDGTVEIDSHETRWPYVDYETPPELTGNNPIHEPTYVGDIDQLLFLDKNWVIVSTNTMGLLWDEINTQSSGALATAKNGWQASIDAGNPDFGDRADMWAARETYLMHAKDTIEVPLGVAANFDITSSDDANYSTAQNPSQCDRMFVSVGGPTHRGDDRAIRGYEGAQTGASGNGTFRENHRVYSYLEMPTSLVNGDTYTITRGTDSVTFLFDDHQTVSRAIKINQGGYLSDAGVKKAYLGACLWGLGELDLSHASTYQIINADTDAVAHSGTVTFVEANPVADPGVDTTEIYGEDVYEIDFSAMTATGTFYIRVPGVGRSWPFEHSTTALSKSYYSLMRQFYRQRIGAAVTTKYTPWVRKKARLGPYYYECENMSFPIHDASAAPSGYNRFDVIGGTTDRNSATAEAPGGWHDAADWDASQYHLGCVFDMLNAYEFNSANLVDDQVDIPESGDGVPDILSEARQGLEIWRLSQDATSGGISSWMETWTHPGIDSSISGDNPPGATKTDYSFGTRTRWTSLVFAAAAAQYARLINSFDTADSTLYETAAVAAYNFGNNSGNSLGVDFEINYTENRGEGPGTGTYTATETDSWIDPYWMHAKLQLWLLTGTDTYITNTPSVTTLEARIQNPYQWRYSYHDFSPWIFYSIIQAYDGGYTGLSALAGTWTTFFEDDGDDRIAELETSNPYECTWDRTRHDSMAWGNTNMPSYNKSLMIAYNTSGLAKYRNAAIQNIDYMQGCNPLGMSWVTGIGYVYPTDIQYAAGEYDNILDPPPGIVIYGIVNNALFGRFRNEVQSAPLDDDGFLSLTQTAGTASAQTEVAHGLSSGDKVVITGASESEYNIRVVITVTGSDTFTFPIDSGAASPATGTPVWKQDFLTADRQISANRPIWRKIQMHPTENTGSCEFTVHETNCASLFAVASLVDYSTVTEKPRPEDNLWGRWFLP